MHSNPQAAIILDNSKRNFQINCKWPKMYLLHVSREFKIKREKISYAGPSDSNNGRKIVECFSVTVKRVCMYTLMGSNLVKVVQLAKKLSTYLPFC